MKSLIRSFIVGVLLTVFATSPTWAGSLTIPNTFTSGTTARASEVNANFSAIETAVDDNDARITQNTAAIPGIATANVTSSSTLPSSNTNVLSVTITAPDSGFVFVSASGMIQVSNHTTAGFSSVYVGVSNISATLSASDYTRLYLSSTVSNGSYEIPYAAHSVYPVSQGVNTFYLVAREDGSTGTGVVYFNRLTAMFIKFGI